MPTYTAGNYILNITYTSIGPATGNVFADSTGNRYTFLNVVGTGATAYYIVAGSAAPTVGTLTRKSGIGDTTVTLNAYGTLIFNNLTYTSVQPAVNAIYIDTNATYFTVVTVNGSGATAVYGISGSNTPAVGKLTKYSGTGDATITLNSYINMSTVTNVGFTRIEAGQTVSTNEWLLSLPLNVIQTSSMPFLDNQIYSYKWVASGASTITVSVPKTVIDSTTGVTIPLLGGYKVRLYVGVGDCEIQINSPSAIPRAIGLYDCFEIFCSSRVVDNVVLSTGAAGTFYITVEKL